MNEVCALGITEIAERIVGLNPDWFDRARAHLNNLTKPLGSLGRLEEIAARMVTIRERETFGQLSKAVYVFAADHGITADGVSAYPREVTHQMVLNFISNGAAINVLARLHGADLVVVDVGVAAELHDVPGMLHRKVRAGTRNMLHEPAMTEEELHRSLQVGVDLAAAAHREGRLLIAIGEMGIGNTTAASAITSALTQQPVAGVTGKGTGLDADGHAHKIRILEAIMEKHFDDAGNLAHSPLKILQCVGGLEIAAMTGLVLGAAAHRIAVIADGFISTSAAALAFAIAPAVRDYLFAGHRSTEPGHRSLHSYIGLAPILALDMRLGEGTGAVLAMSIIESAIRLYEEMATFSSAGVSAAKA
ncbi:MAG: nicotinate-nucleotide--dimethylbenzimidazole phosphoribosyltransferase [Acidobacteriota bacterium]|nr:nicotinate-nucleotide--dimethylbenzimidazole phosphoribosyltransferase [Acidobacteriota bacterium]